MDEGYFAVELGDVSLVLSPDFDKEIKAKLSINLLGGLDVFRFTKNNEASFSTEEFVMHKQINDEGQKTYLYGFNGLYLRSNFIELNSDVMNALANTIISVKLAMLGESQAAAPPAKGGKGAPAAPAAPSEEVLVELKIPLHSLFTSGGGSLNLSSFLSEYPTATSHPLIIREASVLTIVPSVDNEMSGYVLGSRVLSWKSASLSSPPHTWALHAADVLDPKAKVQPTAADLRTKYIDNIEKLIETQTKVASFKLSIGGNGENLSTSEEETTGLMDYMKKLFPLMELTGGKITWDKQAAVAVPAEEDIRQRGDLWRLDWGSSPVMFLHRSEVRKFTKLVGEDPTHAFVPMTVRKVPTPESVAAEGGEVFATGLVDLSGILAAGEVEFPMQVSIQGDLMDVANPECVITFQSNEPLLPKSSLVSFAATKAPASSVIKAPPVASTPTNRDALEELRDEISLTLERIAQEYVSLYPTLLRDTVEVNHQNGDKRDEAMVLEEQKLNFMKYLVNNGLFHDLQERLRPRVQGLIRDRYGAKGRALGKSPILRQIDSQNHGTEPSDVSTDEPTIQAILSELYTFIMKECNVVLNAIFASTVIQKDKEDLENPAKILDEPESYRQLYDRLLREAEDALADGQYQRAETIHMERLQYIDHHVKLQSNHQILHDAYLAYGQFLLQYAAQFVYLSGVRSESTVEGYQMLLKKAREALTVATQHLPNNWETALLYASVLLELDQRELAGEVLHHVIEIQRGSESIDGLDVAFNEFSGYDSDNLVPVHPRAYAVLAAYFSLSERALETRKALLLANRSYAEGSYGETPVSSHGMPRRTIILILAETAQYLVKFGQFQLAHACVRLAKDCERAGTEKAQARNKPAVTPPYIKYMLKRAEAEVTWDFVDSPALALGSEDNGNNGGSQDGTDPATQASLLAPEYSAESHIEAKVSEGFTWYRTRMNNDRVVDCLVSAVQIAMDQNIPIEDMRRGEYIPLRAFLLLGKLLLQTGEWAQATKILLFAAQIYTSASICLLLGITYLRMEKLDDAEQALLEANMLDNRHPDVWAYLCILCIQLGGHRLPEADACLFQTLRLQQSDPNILRELTTSFMAVDKLQTAEDLIRRTIVLESAAAGAMSGNATASFSSTSPVRSNKSGGAGSYNRKLLADILAGQNMAAKAIEEYQSVLQDEDSDANLKLHAAQKCSELLITLGRQEEIPAINQIIGQLSAAVAVTNPSSNGSVISQ